MQLGQLMAELALWINQHPYQCNKEKRIAAISKRNAPRIAVHGEDASLKVRIEVALVEADTSLADNMIHGNGEGLSVNRYVRHIVGRHVSTLIGHHFEVVQTDGERQSVDKHVARQILVSSNTLAQRDDATNSCKMR